MSNKKIFKEIYSNKINKDKNYQEILKRIENNKKINIPKILIPLTSIALVSFLIFINIDNDKSSQLITDTTTSKNEQFELYINNTDGNNSYTEDNNIYLKDANCQEILTQHAYLANINIPEDLSNKSYKEVYIKRNDQKHNNHLNNYQFIYQNKDSNRSLILSFSNKHKPLRNYNENSNTKKSNINNTEVLIYKNNKKYISIFTYNNIYFDIETINIEEEELIDILTSIII